MTSAGRNEPTIFLHVGSPKAGSSSLQCALYAHRHRLEAAGVLYPTTGVYCTPDGWDAPPPEGGHRYLAFAMMGTFPPWDERDATSPLAVCRAALRAELRRWRARAPAARADVVLSSEYWFRQIEPDALRAVVEGLDYRLRVVAYVRRQDRFLESLYDQRVRGGVITEPFERFVERHVADRRSDPWYGHRLERLAAVFGAENVTVRPVERHQLHRGDVVDDFLALLDVEALVGRGHPRRCNPSLPTELTEAIRTLVGRLPDGTSPRERLRLSHHLRLRGWPRDTDPRRYSRLSLPARRALVAHFDGDNAQVARRFLGRAGGRLFEAVADDADHAPWPGLSVEALARAGLFAWARCGAEGEPGPDPTEADRREVPDDTRC